MGKVEEVDEALIDTVCARLREHSQGDDADQAEAFVRQYYRWVPPEDIAERGELDLYGAALAHFNLARTRAPGDAEGARLQPASSRSTAGSRRTRRSRSSPTTCRS